MPRTLSKSSARALVTALSTAGLFACGGKTLDFTPTDGIAAPLGKTMADCPALAANVTLTTGSGDIVITSACIRDEESNYYPPGLFDSAPPPPGLVVVPAGHTYSVVYQFAAAYAPSATGVASSGTVYVAPDNINGNASGCFSLPEDDTSNLVASKTTLDGDLLTQQIVNEVGTGEQISVLLDIDSILFGGPSCANGGVCGAGFGVRFYVGGPPPGQPVDDAGAGAPVVVGGPSCADGAP